MGCGGYIICIKIIWINNEKIYPQLAAFFYKLFYELIALFLLHLVLEVTSGNGLSLPPDVFDNTPFKNLLGLFFLGCSMQDLLRKWKDYCRIFLCCNIG